MVKKFLRATGICVTLMVGIATTSTIFGSQDEDYSHVTVEYSNGEASSYNTKARTVEDFITDVNLTLDDAETIETDLDEEIEDDMVIRIDEGIPLDLSIDGEKVEMTVKTGTTIQSLIKELSEETGIEYYSTNENQLDELTADDEINLLTKSTKIVNTTRDIKYDTVYEETESLPVGEEKVITPGVNGSEEVVEQVIYYGNEEFLRKDISSNVILEPVNAVVQVGVPKTVSTPEGDRVYTKVLEMDSSAYTAGYESTGKRPGDAGYGITATGAQAKKGVVAVDPNVIPLGTELYVEGYGLCVAADTGGSIKGHKIDLFYPNLSDALQYGRRTATVYVLE